MQDHITSMHGAAARIGPSALATNSEFERFFGRCGDDTRRKIFHHLGLPRRRKQAWGEFWHAVGLETEQPEHLWEDLTLGCSGKNILWNASRVAEETGLAATTVNGYCHRKSFPVGFPEPLIDIGPKTRLWLPLEVRAYVRPSLFGNRAASIRRKPVKRPLSNKSEQVSYTGTLEPLPQRRSERE